MLKGEYQAGTPPYGYQKDTKVKNHLIIDNEVYKIVQEIFEMYANQGMTAVSIAEELNRRNITPPCVYLDMPCIRKKKNKEFIWNRHQIGLILKNQTYLGCVVSGKSEQISPKVKKGLKKEKSQYIIVENTHEPIINKELWDKVQARLNTYKIDNKKKYDYILKDLVYCSQCGSSVSFQHIVRKDKKGKIYWEGSRGICKQRLKNKILCENRQVGENVLLRAIKTKIKEEIESIEFTPKELKNIYNSAKRKNINNEKTIEDEIKEKTERLCQIEKEIERIYEQKINKNISIEAFKENYGIINEEKKKINIKLEMLKKEKQNAKDRTNDKINLNQIKKIANKFLSMDKPDRETLEKLVKRIEFDKEKNITVYLTFENPYTNMIKNK